jgi:hypothetical protein
LGLVEHRIAAGEETTAIFMIAVLIFSDLADPICFQKTTVVERSPLRT